MAASRKTPLQIDTSRAPRACAARTAATTSGDGSPCQPGTITVSAVSSASSPCSTKNPKPPAVAGTGPGRSAATVSSYHHGHVELRPGEAEDLDHDPELERGDPGGEQSDDAMHVARY